MLVLASLGSGLVERLPISFPMVFLGLGFVLGGRGVGLIQFDAHDPVLEAVAIISLAFVLFLDAVRLRFEELSREWLVPVLTLGPGTFLVIGIVAGAARLLLDASGVHSFLLGAILASTDPVVLRDVVRDERIPVAVRRALSVEGGVNDVVVLPIIVVLSAIALAEDRSAGGWLGFGAQLFVLGPAVGFAVGGVGSWLVGRVDRSMPIRREYQALYGVGLVLAAYVAGTAVGGDGFLAAFAAGVAVAVLNNELCDCFLEYGETTAEMAMLLAFLLFGAVLSTLVGAVALGPTLAFAAVAVFAARPVAISLVLRHANISRRARAFIGWFGPRGLASLLFALLVVNNGVPGGEGLLAVTGMVVIVSVVLHGASAAPLSAWYGRAVQRETLAEERESTASGLFRRPNSNAVARISPDELAAALDSPDPPIVLDSRSRSQYDRDDATRWAREQRATGPVVVYCT